MSDKIKEIPESLKEFWNKYTSKQKTIIIGVVCVLLVAIAILAWLVSRPKWTLFEKYGSVDDANAVATALEEEGIDYDTSKDGLTIYVQEDDMTKALYTKSDNGLTDTGYTWDAAFDNSMSTTESEKSQKRILALQSEIKKSIIGYSFVDDADIFIDVPESTYSVLDEEGATSITARIDVNEKHKDELTSETAQNLAYWLANTVGTDVENVVINDSEGNCVYNSTSGDGLGGALSGGSLEFCEKLRNTIASDVTQLFVKASYDDVEVGTQGIKFDMDKVEELITTYSLPEGREEGFPTDLYRYSASGANATAGGEPGTASNDDDTDYLISQGDTSTNEVELEKLEGLLTNQTIENRKKELPAIEYEDSSIGIVAIRYRVFEEAQLEADGTLDDMTFEEFIAQNSDSTILEVSEEEIQLISDATGVAEDNISVMAYEVPKFVEKTKSTGKVSDYLMIILAVLIIALLIFVVLRGTAPLQVADEEPELSVEQLLATTKENQSLVDIEFSDKSETRKLIEKFVEENPEAVAQLLRNWLNDDWS